MGEELRVEAEVGRLVWVVENFFEYDERSYHELALFFLIKLPRASPLYRLDEFDGQESLEGGKTVMLIFKWHPLDGLESVPLYPTFLRKALRSLPAAPQYVVHTDRKG